MGFSFKSCCITTVKADGALASGLSTKYWPSPYLAITLFGSGQGFIEHILPVFKRDSIKNRGHIIPFSLAMFGIALK
jgi:hypothetical protein